MTRLFCSVFACAVLILLVATSIPAAETPSINAAVITKKISATPDAKNADKPRVIGHRKEISAFALSRDGRFALTGDEDENNLLWDVVTGTLLREIGTPDAVRIPLIAAAFAPDASTLLWSRYKKTTPVLWEVKSGKRLAILPSKAKGHDAEVVAMAFSPDGRFMATGDLGGVVCLWNSKDRTLVRRYKAHENIISYLSFIPGRGEMVTAGADGSIKLWSVDAAAELGVLKQPGDEVTALTVSKDGGILYAATADGTIKGWNVQLRTIRGAIALDDRQVNGIDLSPDTDQMVIVGEDGTVLLWNMRESRPVWKKDLDESALFARFSPDGTTIITAGGDNWVRVWDAATGKQLRRFAGITE